jgi:hypothetical protein
MKKHLTPQVVTDCYSTVIIIIALLCTGLLWRGHHYSRKFDRTEAGTTLTEIKSQWGEPDGYKGSNGRLVVFYDRSICGDYFFVFDDDSILTHKGIDE